MANNVSSTWRNVTLHFLTMCIEFDYSYRILVTYHLAGPAGEGALLL